MKYYLAVFLLAVAVFVPQSEGNCQDLFYGDIILKMFGLSINDRLSRMGELQKEALSFQNMTGTVLQRRCPVPNESEVDVPAGSLVDKHRNCLIPINTLHVRMTQLITEGNDLLKNMTAAVDSCASDESFEACFSPELDTLMELKENYEEKSGIAMRAIHDAKQKLSKN